MAAARTQRVQRRRLRQQRLQAGGRQGTGQRLAGASMYAVAIATSPSKRAHQRGGGAAGALPLRRIGRWRQAGHEAARPALDLRQDLVGKPQQMGHRVQRHGKDRLRQRRGGQPLRHAQRCLDWSERRPDPGGALGAAWLTLALRRGWVRRALDDRALALTTKARRELPELFGAG